MKINEKNLVAFSVAPTVVQREGYLLKRGEVNRAFQKRWFVLKGNLLFYFERRGDREPLGVIIMEGCTIELTECEEQVCSFRIIFPGRDYVLAADNQELLEEWMKALARCSYAYLKLMVSELEHQLAELNCAEQMRSEEGGVLSGAGSPPAGAGGRQRLNPFNTAEENRIFAQLSLTVRPTDIWEP
uniref:PH domain-containing protein DDB_G0275795-like isoform X1 n=1 Tax=Hirondellea gigas TaxID=1518452 RepID=A0A2P2HZT9_9CRUS